MSHEVLAALPALHATFIGLVGAVYSVFVMYGYQRFEEARQKLEAAARLVDGHFKPGLQIGHISPRLYSESGGMDLNAAREVMRSASLMFPCDRGQLIPASIVGLRSSEEIHSCFVEMMNLIYVASTTYPLVVEDENGDIAYYEKRLQDLRWTVREFAWMWDSAGPSFIQLAEHAERIEDNDPKRLEGNDLHRSKLAQFKEWGVLSDADYKDRISYHVIEKENRGYVQDFVNFFEALIKCNELVMPDVRSALIVTKKCVEDYKVGFHARTMLVIGGVLLVLGVVAPLVLISLEKIVRWTLPDTWEFWISMYSFLPYFFALKVLWDKFSVK